MQRFYLVQGVIGGMRDGTRLSQLFRHCCLHSTGHSQLVPASFNFDNQKAHKKSKRKSVNTKTHFNGQIKFKSFYAARVKENNNVVSVT